MRRLTVSEVDISVEAISEDMPPEDFFDIDCDKICAEIREEDSQGNYLAWCGIRVVARWEGFEGSDTLGGCSFLWRYSPGGDEYAARDACVEDNGMIDLAIDDLMRQVEAAALALDGLSGGAI